MRRRIVLGGLLAFGALSLTAAAFQQPPKPAASAIKVQKLKDNLYVLNALAAGGGGNTSVFITTTGVVVVDTKNPGWGEPLLEKIKTLTNKPVTMIINTHSHPDHNGSNDQIKAAMKPNYIQVVAHENTKKLVTAVPRPNPAVVPDITFANSMRLGTGKDRIDLYYFGAGHTNGDAFVVFPSVRAMCSLLAALESGRIGEWCCP